MKFIQTFLFVFTLFFVSSFSAQSDTTKNVIDKAKIQYKISEAKNLYYSNNFRGALNIYREVLNIDKNNPRAHYGVAEAQYSLGKFKAALEHVKTAADAMPDVEKDVDYLYGNIHHRLGNLDDALIYFEKFKTTFAKNEKKLKEYDIEKLIAQCNYAKKHSTPTEAVITNMGGAINTNSPEFAPCVSLDGKSFVFTSRRSDTKGGQVDVNYDHLYYSDVYLSTWNEEDQEWNKAKPIVGKINTEFHDGALSFMPSGELLLYRNIVGATRSGDIYFSKQSQSSGKWGSPKEMLKREGMNKKLNSTYFESSASITADGNELYFVSERKGGEGQADIYVMKKNGREWTEPENLGASINTGSDEKCVFIHPSGSILFFSSDGYSNGYGSYDLFYCIKDESGNWGTPINMGAPINTVKEEKTISVSLDGKTAYVGAYYNVNNRGNADIYSIDISYLNLLGDK